MTYQVLARKWRPRDFAALVGQEHVVKALRHAFEQGRLHHAYLFTGTRGVGKTTLARILAKCLNCERGVSASPCGQCAACTEIDGGRFVDYVEMDAASNRGVEEMTQLLERSVYAPTAGRFKVYMIDEVHQLSGHAFNAMLKTLEEPPDHLKFILATTEPQKVPVTVLSRCLQFNLKQMPRAAIVAHLARLLDAEGVPGDADALPLLARAAAGSMRDALSLLDQAIAHGAGRVDAVHVREMLGAVDESYLWRLIEALGAGDAGAALAVADEMLARALSFDTALRDLAGLLLQVALVQVAPEALGTDDPERDRIAALAQRLDAETVQLYYEIALQGRGDLASAPDEHGGFVMTILRMLAFRPETPGAAQQVPRAAGSDSTDTAPAPQPSGADFGGDWAALVAQLGVTGMAKELARHAEVTRSEAGTMDLVVSRSMAHLADKGVCEKLGAALEKHFGRGVRLRVKLGDVRGSSVAARDAEARSARRAENARAVQDDKFVQELVTLFDGRVLAPDEGGTSKPG
jgi:DNA polymerase-3 subunit gamma/tau